MFVSDPSGTGDSRAPVRPHEQNVFPGRPVLHAAQARVGVHGRHVAGHLKFHTATRWPMPAQTSNSPSCTMRLRTLVPSGCGHACAPPPPPPPGQRRRRLVRPVQETLSNPYGRRGQ